MCGFIFLWDKNNSIEPSCFKAALDKSSYRGVDAQGVLQERTPYGTLYFGHKRLAIRGLDSSLNQPFTQNNSILLYNGEIYNTDELVNLESESGFIGDTDALMSGLNRDVFDCVERIRGIFSFIHFNRSTNQVILCRDSWGTKPLFILENDEVLIASSTYKAIPDILGVHRISRAAVIQFMVYGASLTTDTISTDIFSVQPGELLEISLKSGKRTSTFYKVPNSDIDLKGHLESTARSNVVSDVPLGLFLSGGIDSALLANFVKEIVKDSFTLGYNFSDDETADAKLSAKSLGISNSSQVCSYAQMKNVALSIGEIIDDFVADQSVVPTFMLCKTASHSNKVMLSADGLDELFRGYTRHLKYYRFSSIERKFISFGLRILSVLSFLPWKPFQHFVVKDQLYDRLLQRSNPIVVKALFRKKKIRVKKLSSSINDIDAMLMSKEILRKVDVASMRNSLEVRVPFLESTTVKYMELRSDIAMNETKPILRKLAFDLGLPLHSRKKSGFGWPASKFIYEEREFICNTITRNMSDSIVDFRVLNRLFKNINRNHYIIWNLYVLSSWIGSIECETEWIDT